jgi:hypothetical protein
MFKLSSKSESNERRNYAENVLDFDSLRDRLPLLVPTASHDHSSIQVDRAPAANL